MIRPSEITWRNGLLVPLGVAWFAVARPQSVPHWVSALGAGITLAGVCMRLWSAGCLVKNDKLSLGGPYRHLRDPMYFGSMLCASGLLVVAGNFGLLAAFHVAFHIFTMPRKQRQEGQRLLRRFGMDYANYVVAVSSLVPRLTPYPSPDPTDFSLGRAMKNNHEHGIWLMLAGVGAVLLVKGLGLVPWLTMPFAVPHWI